MYQSANQPVSTEHVILTLTRALVKTSGKDPTAIHLVSACNKVDAYIVMILQQLCHLHIYISVCEPACVHGTCGADHTCQCEDKWEGPDCNTPSECLP